MTFEPGARTAWHTHPLGQTLIVTAGIGWTQCMGEPRQEFRPGDVSVLKTARALGITVPPTSLAIADEVIGSRCRLMARNVGSLRRSGTSGVRGKPEVAGAPSK
jgi:hypothetical protein